MHFSLLWLLLAAVPLRQVPENTGTKMTIRHGFGGNSSEQIIYLQGDRKRMEFRNSLGGTKADGSQQWLSGPRLAAITRCDLGQTFELNLDAGEYVSAPYPPKPLTREEVEARGLSKLEMSQSKKPTLRIETTTVDTGERREFFGRTARHVITTRKQTPLEGSHSEAQETVTDGWYIDLDPQISCERRLSVGKRAHSYLIAGSQPAEKLEFVDIGDPETGFAVQLVTASKDTYTLPDGTKKQTDAKSETLVTQLEQGSLDPGLFEIPSGFKHVQQIERNPRVPASSSQTMDLWERLKTRVASLLNR
ncbi:MAG: hypothetical protein LAN64_13070 [Acidobacteriia bacterium]|nr:hypothetical protein [Terriglobia bacterium]